MGGGEGGAHRAQNGIGDTLALRRRHSQGDRYTSVLGLMPVSNNTVTPVAFGPSISVTLKSGDDVGSGAPHNCGEIATHVGAVI